MSKAGPNPRWASPEILTIFSDGTLRLPEARDHSHDEHLFARMDRMRVQLGSAIDDGIGTIPSIPLGGDDPFDHPLPATLAFLDVSGDLASCGWRIGTGYDASWHGARDEAQRRIDAARIAFLGYEGSLGIRRLGPIAVAIATHTAAGERTLGDPGLVRDLPELLTDAYAREASALETMIPGATTDILVDERGALAALEGQVPTASGYRFHRALGRLGVTQILGESMNAAIAKGIDPFRLTVVLEARIGMLRSAIDAGVRSLAVNPLSRDLRQVGEGWEVLAEARENGARIRFLCESETIDSTWQHMIDSWRQLGFAADDQRGMELAVTRRTASDLSDEPGPGAYVRGEHLDLLNRKAHSLADQVVNSPR